VYSFRALLVESLIFVGLAALFGCHQSSHDQASYMRGLSGPTLSPTWPSYAAVDYGRPGHPSLTNQQAALIRKTLALLKPCQADLLRYAFPKGRVGPTSQREMVLFFQPPDASIYPHVLWTMNLAYKPAEGEAFAMPVAGVPLPKGQGTAYAVVHQSCHPSDLAATPTPR
jgi:hypothetical protein